VTPTQRSLALLKKANCICAVVERWVKFPGKKGWKSDLFGFADILAVNVTGAMYLIQTTTRPNMSARRRKIMENKNAIELLVRGVPIILHGWKKNKAGKSFRYECHIEEIKALGSE